MSMKWRFGRSLVVVVVICLTFSLCSPGQAGEAAVTHRVAPGDTLWLISQRYNTTVTGLMEHNRLASSMIYPGQMLSVPANVHIVSRSDTMFLIAQRYGVNLQSLLTANPNVSPNYIIPGQSINIPGGTAVPTSSPLPSRGGHNFSQQEIDLLARLVHSEAAGEPFIGQVAVAASILNRIKSPIYPNTLQGVVYQVAYGYYQYSPVQDGRINLPANRTAYQAVYDAIGGSDPSNGALGFYNPGKTSNQWVRQQQVTTVIGNHVFFR